MGEAGIHDALGAYRANLHGVFPVRKRPSGDFFPDCVAIFIKENDNLTDERTADAIAENPYMQYFLGLTAFQAEPLFAPSMMVHFRKRSPVEEVGKINKYICTSVWPEQQRNVDRNDAQDENPQDDHPNPPDANVQEHSAQSTKKDKNTSKKKLKRKSSRKNRGKLIMDATVAPADIKFPPTLTC